jgi:hypothetical protein
VSITNLGPFGRAGLPSSGFFISWSIGLGVSSIYGCALTKVIVYLLGNRETNQPDIKQRPMSYASYLRSCGVKKGEFNSFVMTKPEWLMFQSATDSVETKHQALQQRLLDCQDAAANGLASDAAHAKVNEKNAFYALLKFEVDNGIASDTDQELYALLTKLRADNAAL